MTSDVTIIKPSGDEGVWKIFIPIDPVPASRPRITRAGWAYYGKRYTKFRKEASSLLSAADIPIEFPLSGLLAVSAVFTVVPPKTTKRKSPRGDVDNYFKTLDVLNEIVWEDDDQLVLSVSSKVFGNHSGIDLEVAKIERVPKARTLSEMWFARQPR